MPYLGDYLGSLLTEITNARVQSDLESARVAELYANHYLLKHLPVPHLRLPKVSLELPVVVKGISDGEKEEPVKPEVIVAQIKEKIPGILARQIKTSKIKFPEKNLKKLSTTLKKTIDELKLAPGLPLSLTHITDELVNSASRETREFAREKRDISDPDVDKFLSEFRASINAEFSQFLHEPERLDVGITTAELREAGPKEILANLRLSISEEAVEWTVISSDGESRSKLIPE